MPFDSTLISLMVHRIGNTLLIDEFDLANHLILNESKQWSWLKRFVDNMIVNCKPNSKPMITKKIKTRDELQTKNMLCKFLHYSVDENLNQTKDLSKELSKDKLQLSPKKVSQNENIEHNNERKDFYFSHYNQESHMSEIIAKQLDAIEDNSESTFPGFLRNVLWTFEDIRMLVASNMPIFGDSHHPAVSLRLHDMKRPINILTGLDYWLDNLMSSVPEVMMCYHLEGIVQKYELVKTEEIPQMSSTKGPLFSPKVVQNVAQNILSFLKSKATKSGHTYWLFKGKHDDVVKLYDLTTLCVDYIEESDTNPFAIPVAMLLYRVAKNMKDINLKRSPAIDSKIHKLLSNCLSLLDPSKHSQIVSSANYLLSDVYIPNDIDPTLLPSVNDNNSGSDGSEGDYDFDDIDSSDGSSDDSTVATLEVNKLSVADSYANEKQKKSKQSNSEFDAENSLDWSVKCERALKHIIEGLKSLFHSNVQKQEETIYKTSKDENQKYANPNKAIPLDYSSLNEKDDQNGSLSGKELTQVSPQVIPNWKTCLEVCLLQKGAQVFCILSELSNAKGSCLKALKYIRMGVMCYEIALDIIEKSEQINYYKEPIACLLALCGDIHVKVLNSSVPANDSDCDNDNKELNDLYFNQLPEILEKFSENKLIEEFHWAYNPVISSENSIEQRLKVCYRCYEEALYQLNDIKPTNKAKNENNALQERLMKRLGYICNELANYYMNESLKHFNHTISEGSTAEQQLNDSEVSRLERLTNKSLVYFTEAVELFRKVEDRENISLMLSNTGRLMRTCAHIFAPTFRHNSSDEFSAKERQFYVKAIDYYKSALKELGTESQKKYMAVSDNINWELSTTLYTIGCLIQDFAPLSTSAFESVEKEISKYFVEALDFCENGQKRDTSRNVLYQYRNATISHRLASLYHNSYRNMSEETERRKQVYNQSNSYYEKSRLMYRLLNDKEEYVRVCLEQIGLHERNLAQLNGFASKVKCLHLILSIILTIHDMDFTDTETEEDKEKIDKLLQLLSTRIGLSIKALIKCYSNKASKYKDLIQKWTQIDEFIGKTNASKRTTVYDKLNKICVKIISSKLLETSPQK
ncbi:unnamed protein product [Medioppia subpectinata]|uniref:Erythroid differentiation-related factor 1 n=1 Tax=Medioppia subpectinata TaxID=1979941 RepID=A0A7R9KGB9_9ACAR|nr:unnamed protein product [Medioppia subpectinata]CAG2102842.1 unnamed protein product [Medioppia subpectinata]